VSEEVPAHAMIVLAMADDGLDGGAASELAFDGGSHAPFLAPGYKP